LDGVAALHVLSEDAKFPTTKQKLIDLTREKKVRASVLLEELSDRTAWKGDKALVQL